MIRRLTATVAAALLLAVHAAAPASGQSALVTQGLGLPVEPLDARSRGLGGVGIGLPDGEMSWLSPGGLYGLPAPAMVASYQYDHFETTGVDPALTGNTARLPFLMGAFPIGPRVAVFGGFGGFLEQNWRVENPDTITFGGDSVTVRDVSSSSGGVSRIRLGATYQVIDGLGLGVGVDLFTGSVERVQGRTFGSEPLPACCRASWDYRGLGYTAGVHWAPSSATGVAVSASYGGTLEATPRTDEAEAREYDLPLIVRGGLSGRVGENTLVAFSGAWDGWSSLSNASEGEGDVRDSWSLHGGLEWDGAVLRGRPLPLRLGARTGALPFRWTLAPAGAESGWADERALTGGAGLVLGGGAVRTDFSIELGGRGSESIGFDESFWRFGLSVRVLGR